MAGAGNRKHLAMKQQFTLQSLRIHYNNACSDGLRELNAAFNVQSGRNDGAGGPHHVHLLSSVAENSPARDEGTTCFSN